MTHMLALALSVILVGCTRTACEQEQDVRIACAEASGALDTTEGALKADLPECASDSEAACKARCLLDLDDACAVSEGTAPREDLRAWDDCRVACEPEEPSSTI